MKKAYKYISLTIFIIAVLAIASILLPFLQSIREPEEFRAFIGRFGVFGIGIMFLIQAAQIIVALIPGELVEFLAGCMYGTLGGLLVSLAGATTGQAIIFWSVRKFGHEFVEAVAGSKAMEKMKFLKDEKKLKRIIFILYFLPGTPKALISYAVPFTKISLRDFLWLTVLARIPSVISSTYAGSALVKNDYKPLLIVYAIVMLVSACGALIYRLYEKKVDRNNKKEM